MARRSKHLKQSNGRLLRPRAWPLLAGLGFFALGATMTAIGVFATQQDLDQKRAELFEHQAHELTR